MDSTISLLPKSEISRFWPFSETVQTGLRLTWSETPKTGFLALRLISQGQSVFSEDPCYIFECLFHLFQWGYFIMLIEWMTFVATHTRGANWKIPDEEFPWICKKVMANGNYYLRVI